jgi:GT2 family glycosyltransferase
VSSIRPEALLAGANPGTGPVSHGALLSVIMPVHNAAGLLPRTLGALRNSDLPRDKWELIVVDDGSSDETSLIAARYADTVVTLPGKASGPAYARNRGFEVSRGDIIIFIDSDCVAYPDTLSRFGELFASDPALGAAFGSYDDRPPASGIMSQYRNLVDHYVHHQNAGEVETFWAGLGGIRREVFAEAGMYDEWHYSKPQIEDIELGGRIRKLGCRILLDPSLQVTHLKKWTLREVIRTDLRDRGIPRARLLMHRREMPPTAVLNLGRSEKFNTLLICLAVVLLLSGPVVRSPIPLWIAIVCVAIVLVLNTPLWRFFARVRGPVFAILVMPAQLMFYLINGISFGVGWLLQHLIGPPLRDAATSAYAEVGVQRWPPVPTKNRSSSWTAGDQ